MSVQGGPDIVTNGLVFHLDAANTKSYTFNSSTWYDLSSSKNDITLNNGPVFNSTNLGNLWFDGSTRRGIINSPVNLFDLSVGTLSVWFNASGPGMILSMYDASITSSMYLFVGGFTGTFADESLSFVNFSSPTVIAAPCIRLGESYYLDNKWHNVVYKTGDNNSKMYVDGKEMPVTYINGNASINAFSNIPGMTTMTIASRAATFYANINISNIQIYNKALTNAQIIQNYNALKSRYVQQDVVTNGLVLSLDAANRMSYPGSGTVWHDLTSYNYDGSLANGVIFNSSWGGVFMLDGSNDYIDCGNILNNVVSGSDNAFSYNCWFYPSSSSNKMLLAKSADSGLSENQRQIGILARDLGAGYKVDFVYYMNLLGSPVRVVRSTNTLVLNAWNNVCTTYDGSIDTSDGLNRVNIYINNVRRDGSLATSSGVLSGTIQYGTARVGIGAQIKPDGTASANNFPGMFSVVQLYNRVLTSTEVQQNYEALRGRYGL